MVCNAGKCRPFLSGVTRYWGMWPHTTRQTVALWGPDVMAESVASRLCATLADAGGRHRSRASATRMLAGPHCRHSVAALAPSFLPLVHARKVNVHGPEVHRPSTPPSLRRAGAPRGRQLGNRPGRVSPRQRSSRACDSHPAGAMTCRAHLLHRPTGRCSRRGPSLSKETPSIGLRRHRARRAVPRAAGCDRIELRSPAPAAERPLRYADVCAECKGRMFL